MAWPYSYNSGVTLYDKTKAFTGYTLITTITRKAASEPNETTDEVRLVDMTGKTVHTWKTPYPVWYARLMPDGQLVTVQRRLTSDTKRPGYGEYAMGGATGLLMELDWDSNIAFEYFDPVMHHDFRKLPNGNYIYIGWEKMPADLAAKIRGGQKGTEHKDGTMFGDFYRELDPNGKPVWEWHGIEHFDPDIEIIGAIHPREEWTHINTVDVMPDGNILSCSRHTDGAFIIDRQSGDIIWRWGNMAYLDEETGMIEHRNGESPNTMGGPHDAHHIAENLPGAGHMLIYDNGMYEYHSRAKEVDVQTGEVVWMSEAGEGPNAGRTHFSHFISGADRLPNGNTLICSGCNGVVFEVTSENEMVWHWIRTDPELDAPVRWGLFRAHRFSPDYCPQFQNLPPAEGD